MLERDLLNESTEAITNGLPYIQAMRAFSRVVDSCFSQTLSPDYKAAIREFKRVYLELGIFITPKVTIDQQFLLFIIHIFNRFTLSGSTLLSFWKQSTARTLVQIQVCMRLFINVLFYKYVLGLGYFSEQSFESLNSDMKVR